MALPKGYRNNINILNQKIGFERRQEILDDISSNGTFLPRGVNEEDMDEAFLDFFENDKRVYLSLDGRKIPAIFLTIQRWSEFTKTWKFTDEYRNIDLPFITIVRQPDIQQGQNQAGLYNIPPYRTYTYMKVPTWDGIRKGIDLYKIPQPVSVDITYNVRLFTNRMKDINKFNGLIQKAFQSRQCYITVKGHPMPLILESISDESNINEFEETRFYVQNFEIKLMGYLVDEEDFEVVPTLNRVVTTLETDEKLLYNDVIFEPLRVGNTIQFTFVFKPKSFPRFNFVAQYETILNQLDTIENLSRIIIRRNNSVIFDGTVLTTPLIINNNDLIDIQVFKNYLTTGKFVLNGTTTS